MKKYLLFAGSFCVSFLVLQVLSGMFLTMFNSNVIPGEKYSTLSSQVEFGTTSFVPPLVVALTALAIAFGITKLFFKKKV